MAKAKLGRPSKYTAAIAEHICELIANGRSLRSICDDRDMPSTRAVDRWLAANEGFRRQYAHARNRQADYYADQIIEIADTETDAHKARNRIDARKWTASRLAPKKYGDKVQNEVTGKDGGPIMVVTGVPRGDD